MKRTPAGAALDPRLSRRLGGVWEVRKTAAQTKADALRAEARTVAANLANPPEGADVAQLAARADAIVAELQALADAEEARQRILNSPHLAGGDDDTESRGLIGGGSDGDDDDTDGRGREARRRSPGAEVPDLGQRFVTSDTFKEFRARGYSGGAARIDVPGDVRALLDTTIFADPKMRVPGIVQPKERVPRLLDLIDRQSMTTSSLEYLQEATFTDNAAETTEGALKPEAAWTSSLITTAAATIANWANITRQAAADNSQVNGYIRGRLIRGLIRRLEGQIINGNGTAPNLRGILNTAGIGSYTAAASEAAVISVRKAKTVAQLSEYEPDVVAMSPTAWERIELSTNTQGSFRVTPNVTTALGPRIWGMNVVTSTVFAATTFLLGSFSEGATLWEREGVAVYMTDSHASNFTSNILTLLVEVRAALAVWRPAAFVKGTLDAAGN